jgi:DNA modification methylase
MTELAFTWGNASFYSGDCLEWLKHSEPNSIHGVVTDPPYGLVEYQPDQIEKLRAGSGGIWRIPPSFDGHGRSPLPRFTVLDDREMFNIYRFFHRWARALIRPLVPGAHVLVASNPLLVHIVASAIHRAGFESRGQIIRLTQTMRGGDRPKNAHKEFHSVSVMPRSQHEPWVVFRKPIEGRVQDNLRKWSTGGLRRISSAQPFGDVITSSPTRRAERDLAPHPSLKPQAFLRQVVRAVLPLGEGIVLDTFAGSGSTLAAAEAIGYASIGIELSQEWVELARQAIPKLVVLGASAASDELVAAEG